MSRRRSISCSSTTSQSSIASIYPRINQCSPPVQPAEGHTNVHGSFTTTIPTTLWLRAHLTLQIPPTGIRLAKQRDPDCGYDTPPDSPLSFFHSPSGSRRSPSITRTFDWDESSISPPASPSLSSPLDSDDSPAKLHPVLEAVEKGSRFSCRSICSTCRKTGTNFPRCPRCDEMWCSRACRLQGGKKHTCAIRRT